MLTPVKVAGPMWLGPLHTPEFCAAVVETVEREKENYKTYARIKGMVSVARDVSLLRVRLTCC